MTAKLYLISECVLIEIFQKVIKRHTANNTVNQIEIYYVHEIINDAITNRSDTAIPVNIVLVEDMVILVFCINPIVFPSSLLRLSLIIDDDEDDVSFVIFDDDDNISRKFL
ncbi:hypothetical protein DERP_014068 [Dermatophagoides pteronyssinus]|uniref:Uncharacterized protein n=1 Tax=Dermatophagoides pteronyssinus TaxID=6956 RepID=A0ABQ8J6X5_DERPT|nr:hypothetical protein DERP_014068 [Dermatophagoides pteronyssinus]